MDTIFAETTPPGRGGVSIVRLSGPDSRKILIKLAGSVPEPRVGYVRRLRDGDDLIDHALVLWFAEGQSFTGEETVEFQIHGAPIVVERLGRALLALGARRAEAGEFSRRAFLNGKMSLSDAEGLADLLAAETEAQRQLAMQISKGELSSQIDRLREKLVRAGALLEVSIDFADEEVPQDIPAEAFPLLHEVKGTIAEMLARYPATERLRQGYEVAIIGPPNVGKSTLLNQIARRDIALVSDIAGTTRDIIELRTDLRGLPVTFLDTAGLRGSSDVIETMGIERARQRAVSADLRIHLTLDGQTEFEVSDHDIVVWSKADIADKGELRISAKTGEGIATLLDLVYSKLKVRTASVGLISTKRQADALGRAQLLLNTDATDVEFLAEHIRSASAELATLIGRVGAEDYLDEVFSSFCIGK